MSTVLLVVQLLVAIALIAFVLMQRSSNDGFGLGSGGGGGVMSGRAKANFMTRTTAILAAIFMANSLLLAIVTANESSRSLVDRIAETPAEVSTEEGTAIGDAPAKEAPLSAPLGDAN